VNGIPAELKGVNGWLLLLCVNLTILDPFANLLNLAIATHTLEDHISINTPRYRDLCSLTVCAV